MRGNLAILSRIRAASTRIPLIRLRAGPQTPSPKGGGHSYRTKASTMYHPFFQFVLPRLGQVALDALLYLNFLQLPPLQLVAPVAGAVLRTAACADGRAGVYQPRPARAGHRVCRTSCDILLHRYRHRAGAAAHRRHTADCLAYYLAGRHNAVAVDGPYHVVGAAACAAALYDKIQPDNAENSAERQADHRAGQ